MTDRAQNNTANEAEQPVTGQPEQSTSAATPAAADQPTAGQAEQGGDGMAAPTLAELEQRIAQLELQAEEHRENWLRATADFRNLKRRTEQERAELIKTASAGLILKSLPILDDLERAMAHVPEEIAQHPWFEGIKLVQRKLQTILEGEGVKPIEALGQDFDPTLHEAVMHEPASPELQGKVLAELQKGYKLGDRVLRPALVKVGG